MKNRLLILLCLLGLFLSLNSSAQVNKEVFREFEVEDFLSSSMTIGKRGMIMYGWKDKRTFKVKLLDTDLEDKEEYTLELAKSTIMVNIGYHKKADKLLILFKEGKRTYRLTTIDFKANETSYGIIELPKKTMLTSGMFVVKKNIWMLAKGKKNVPLIAKIPMSKPSAITFETLAIDKTKKKPYTTGMRVLDSDEVAVIYNHGKKKLREYDVMILDNEFKTRVKSLFASVKVENRLQIYSVDITRLAEDEYSIAGMYHKSRKALPEGMYYMKYKNNKMNYFSKYAYADFKHFLDYMNDKRRAKIEKKLEKKKAKGKDVSIQYLAVMHPTFVMEGDELVVVAEYYYPTYRTETYTTYVNGNPQTQTRQVFDGYQYTHAMAVGIDQEGNKLYDVYVPLHTSYKPYSAITFLKISNTGTELSMMNIAGIRIYSSVLASGKLDTRDTELSVKIPSNQKEKWTSSAATWWYDRYFLIMQSQTVKEKGLLGKKTTHYYGMRVEVPEA